MGARHVTFRLSIGLLLLLSLLVTYAHANVVKICGGVDVPIASNTMVVIPAGCANETSLILGPSSLSPPLPPGADGSVMDVVSNVSIIAVDTRVFPTLKAANGTSSLFNVSYLAKDCRTVESSVLKRPLVDVEVLDTVVNVRVALVNVVLYVEAPFVVSWRPGKSAFAVYTEIRQTTIVANTTGSAFVIEESESIRDVAFFIVQQSNVHIHCKLAETSAFRANARSVLDGYHAEVDSSNITFQVRCVRILDATADLPFATTCGKLRFFQAEGAILDARTEDSEATLRNVTCHCVDAHLAALVETSLDVASSFQRFAFRVTGGYNDNSSLVTLHRLRVAFTGCTVRIEASSYPPMVLVYAIGGGTSDAKIVMRNTHCSGTAAGPLSATQSARAASVISIAHDGVLSDSSIVIEHVSVTHSVISGLSTLAIDAALPSALIATSSDVVQLRRVKNVTLVVTHCQLMADLRNGTMPGYSASSGRAALAILGVALVRITGQTTSMAEMLTIRITASSVTALIGAKVHAAALVGAVATHATVVSMESHCMDCWIDVSDTLVDTVFDGIEAAQTVAQFLLHPSVLHSQPSFQACYDYFASDPLLSSLVSVVQMESFFLYYLLADVNHTRLAVDIRFIELRSASIALANQERVSVGASIILPATRNVEGTTSVSAVSVIHRFGPSPIHVSLMFCFRGCNHNSSIVGYTNVTGLATSAWLQVASFPVRLINSVFRIQSCTTLVTATAINDGQHPDSGLIATIAHSVGGTSEASIAFIRCTFAISDNIMGGHATRLVVAEQGSIVWDDGSTVIFGCNSVGGQRPLPAEGFGSFLQNVPQKLVLYDKLLPSTKGGCFLPWSRTVSRSLEPQRPVEEPVAYIPSYAASAGLSAAMNTAAAMDALPLVALGQSACGSPAMGSASSLSQFLLSPFYAFGVAAAAAGNVALILVFVAVHYAAVRWNARSEPHAKAAAASGRSLSLRHRIAYVFAPCRFPNMSIVCVSYLLQGTAFYGTKALFQGTPGSTCAGLAVVALFSGVTYSWRRFERSDTARLFTYHSYRQAHRTSRLGACARWSLPHGYWGNAAMRGSIGQLRAFVRCSSATVDKEGLIAIVVVVVVPCISQALMGIDAPSSAVTWWCPAQWMLLVALSLTTSVALFWVRPARVPCQGVLMGLLFGLQAALFATSFAAVPTIGDPTTAADVLVVLSIVYTIVAILKNLVALATFRWELVHRDRRRDVKEAVPPPTPRSAEAVRRRSLSQRDSLPAALLTDIRRRSGHGTAGMLQFPTSNIRHHSSDIPSSRAAGRFARDGTNESLGDETMGITVAAPRGVPIALDGSAEMVRSRRQNLAALIELIALNNASEREV